MRLQLWEGRGVLRDHPLRERVVTVHDEPDLTQIRAWRPTAGRCSIGRSSTDDVVIDDLWVSRGALTFDLRGDGWWASMNNRHGLEHRRWAGQADPATAPGEVPLGPGEHAFLFTGGPDRSRAYCVLATVDDPEVPTARGPNDDDVTPAYERPSRALGGNLDRFCRSYKPFLLWPPLWRPEFIRDSVVQKEDGSDPAHAIASVIGHAIKLGYSPGPAPSTRRTDLPAFLASRGVLVFEYHAVWRPVSGGLPAAHGVSSRTPAAPGSRSR